MKYSEFLAKSVASMRDTASTINRAANNARRVDIQEAAALEFEADQLTAAANAMENVNQFMAVIGDDITRQIGEEREVRILIMAGDRIVRDMEIKPV